MAGNEELLSFVKEALSRGMSRAEIEAVLLKAGWAADQVKGAISAFADIEFPLPVPRPKPYLSARDAFLYLVLFVTMYISAYNLGRLLFQFIDRAYPDAVLGPEAFQYRQAAIRWSISSLVIAFPVFLYLSYALSRAIRLDPAKRGSKVRKWLTYMTLFWASVILIGDLTYLLNNFLSGELTLRFLLKCLTVGFITGGIFAYYLWDLRLDEKENKA